MDKLFSSAVADN